MQGLRYLSWLPLLLLVLLVAGCEQFTDILTPPGPQPSDLTVSPNGGPYTPPGISPNEQVMLVAQQGLTAGDGTMYLRTLKSLERLIARVGERVPPGGVLAAPPRVGLQGRLSPQRALELSRLTPITQLGAIQTSVDTIQFTGSAQLDEATQQVKATLDANSTAGTRLKWKRTFHRSVVSRASRWLVA